MDTLIDNYLEDDRRPSVIDPELRFADRHRDPMGVLLRCRQNKPFVKLLFIKGQNRDVPQTAIIHYQN